MQHTPDNTNLRVVAGLAPNPQSNVDDAVGNDKIATVPAAKVWEVLWAHVAYTSDANAGNRVVTLQIRDSADAVVFETESEANQAASGTEDYHFLPGAPEPIGTKAGQHYLPLPPSCLLDAGWDVRVFDSAGIAATDTADVTIVYREYTA